MCTLGLLKESTPVVSGWDLMYSFRPVSTFYLLIRVLGTSSLSPFCPSFRNTVPCSLVITVRRPVLTDPLSRGWVKVRNVVRWVLKLKVLTGRLEGPRVRVGKWFLPCRGTSCRGRPPLSRGFCFDLIIRIFLFSTIRPSLVYTDGDTHYTILLFDFIWLRVWRVYIPTKRKVSDLRGRRNLGTTDPYTGPCRHPTPFDTKSRRQCRSTLVH